MNAGNRFDVPGGGVLYAATLPQGAFAETLSRFRPTAAMRNLPVENGEHLMAVGSIAADWRTRRQLVEFGLTDPLPFLDVDAPETHAFLTSEMAATLEVLGIETLDVALVRGAQRHLTRAIAQWAFTAVDDDEQLRFSGIRYGSRLGAYECWAIFLGCDLDDTSAHAIEKTHPALIDVAKAFDLTIH